MSQEIRNMLEACPQCNFTELHKVKLPCLFYIKSYSRTELLVIQTITAKGRQATALRWPNGMQTMKIYKGSYHNEKFYALTPDLIQLLGVTHEEIVKTAVADGLEIPVLVRILYPELFVEIPEGIDKERLKKSLSPDFVKLNKEHGIYTTPETIAAAIEEEHAAIVRWTQLNSLFVKQPDAEVSRQLITDRERIAQNHFHNIEFYHWLEPLVQPGAVFGAEKELSGESETIE